MSVSLKYLFLIFCTWFSAPVWAATPLNPENTAEEWLSHMAKAVRDLSYRGRMILMNGDQLNTVEVIHGVVDGETWERLIHLTGEPAEILRRGDRVSCLHPKKSTNFETVSPGSANPLKAFALNEGKFAIPTVYYVKKHGSDRVAGREAKRVDVLPKDRARYGYQLWLDKSTGLLIKSVTVGSDGRGLEVFEFVDITFNPDIDQSLFEPGEGLQWIEKKSADTEQPTKPHWRIQWLPAGFHMASHELRKVGDTRASTKVYSDGLAAFSIFLERVDPALQAEGTRTHGATTALSRRLPSPASDYLVTVVGEIPMETAMQVAMGVRVVAD
ncbi:MAG: MucB/RseB C-terminal domain-containing protein [Pseudomonadales bacterium]|nr:MucB/RseB C-terminal domain-containing protein [Pseudomonadales bacterium]